MSDMRTDVDGGPVTDAAPNPDIAIAIDTDIDVAERALTESAAVAAVVGEIAAHEPPGRLTGLAARIGCTEGQIYSMAIGLVAATALVLAGGVQLGSPAATASGLPTPLATAPPAVVVAPTATTPPLLPPLGPLPIQDLATPAPSGSDVAVPGTGTSTPQATLRPIAFPALLRIPAPGSPRAVASDGTRMFIGTDNSGPAPSELLVYTQAGQLERRIAITGQPKDHVGGLTAAAVRGGTVLLADRSRGTLLEINPTSGQQHVLATIPDLPPCLVGITGTCQPGGQDKPPTPEAIAVRGNYAYVSDAGQGTIWRYDLTSKKLAAWYSRSDLSVTGPSGLSFDTTGSLLFTVAQSADTAALLRGALYRLGVDATGVPTTRTLLASFDSADQVGALVVGRADDAYVAMRGTGGVAVVSRAGRVTFLEGGAAAKLPSPTGVYLVDGTVFVADAGKPASATSGSVHALRLEDGPAA